MHNSSNADSSATWHGTTILTVRKGGRVVIAGDGQVSLGATVIKANAKKVRAIGRGDQRVRFRERCRERLFDQQMKPTFGERAADLGVCDGRHRDDRGLGQFRERFDRRQNGGAVFGRDRLRLLRVGVHDAHQFDPWQGRQDSHVVATKRPRADHANP